MRFTLQHTSDLARAGLIELSRGTIETPIFMPVGTYGAVKTLAAEDLLGLGAQIILGNTFHLNLRPGLEVIESFGGLHNFNGWQAPILTDSGGFQVFSLGKMRKIDEQGVVFRSPVDGKKIHITPEESIRIQHVLGSDIIMAFDECTPYPSDETTAQRSMELSMRWAERCAIWHKANAQPHHGELFAIVQGGMYPHLRRQSLQILQESSHADSFSGYAIGGLSVGEPKDLMQHILEEVADELPKQKPRYLMGVGKPLDILHGIAQGVDMFDCVLPTRNARNGQLFTWKGVVRLRNAKFRYLQKPIDEDCQCPCCQHYSLAYLHHLDKIDEMLGSRLCTIHNVYFFLQLVKQARKAIVNNEYAEFFGNHQHLDERI